MISEGTELGKQEAGLRHLSQSLPCALQQFSGPQFTIQDLLSKCWLVSGCSP